MSDKAMKVVESLWGYLSSCWTTLYLLPSTCFPHPEIYFSNRRFKIIKLVRSVLSNSQKRMQLGEGGYSFIYLVKEIPTAEKPFVVERFYALKMVRSAKRRFCECNIDEFGIARSNSSSRSRNGYLKRIESSSHHSIIGQRCCSRFLSRTFQLSRLHALPLVSSEKTIVIHEYMKF